METHKPLQVSALTLNCWGLWLVARLRERRMAALAAWLRSVACKVDIVLLQEVWCAADVELLRQAGVEGQLPHSFHYQSGAIGSGLVLLTRFPIAEVSFHPFSARGDPAALLQGDFLAGKGVGWAALDTPAGRLSVFNTHLSANYGQQWQRGAPGLPHECRLPRDTLAGVRLLQVLELASFVSARSRGAAGVLLGGDLNAAPDTLEMAVLRALLPQLQDAWAVAQPLLLGATANALESSFTTAGAGHGPIRIDYLLTTGQPVRADLALSDTGQGFSYSDHLGVTTLLQFGGSDGSSSPEGDPHHVSGSGGHSSGAPGTHPQASSSPMRAIDGHANGWEAQHTNKHAQGLDTTLDAAAATCVELMRRRPAPFQHAAAAIEQTALEMRAGRRRLVCLAGVLLATGCGCLAALLARPCWLCQQQQGGDAWVTAAPHHAASYVAQLGGVGAAFGCAGVLLLTGFVGRGMEMRALQQAALELRLAVGVCEAIVSPRPSPMKQMKQC